MLQQFIEWIVTFVREHEAWAIPVVFLVSFGESFCFFSLFWPGTAILAGLTALLAASGASVSILWPSILAAGLGGSLGYALSYWIGLYFKDSIHKIWPFSSRPGLIPKGELFFSRYGAFGVFLGHFFGPVRAVIPVVAGMFAMRQLPFQVANVASAFIWASGVIAPAFFLVTFKDEVLSFMRDHEAVIALIMFTLALGASIPYALLFFPPAILFVVVGALYLLAGGSFWPIWLASAAGAFVGDLAAYRIGQRYNDDLARTWLTKDDADTIARVRDSIEASGSWSVVTSKFLGIKRAWVPVVAGTISMPWRDFIIASALSSLLWAAVFLTPRYFLIPFGV